MFGSSISIIHISISITHNSKMVGPIARSLFGITITLFPLLNSQFSVSITQWHFCKTLHGGIHCQTLAATFDHLFFFFFLHWVRCMHFYIFFFFFFLSHRWLLLLPSNLGFFFFFFFFLLLVLSLGSKIWSGFFFFSLGLVILEKKKKKKVAPSDRYGAHK